MLGCYGAATGGGVQLDVDDARFPDYAQIRQEFRIVQVLAGKGPDAGRVGPRYGYRAAPPHARRKIGRGDRLIWVAHRREHDGKMVGWLGAKALPDTREARKAVVDAAKTHVAWGPCPMGSSAACYLWSG